MAHKMRAILLARATAASLHWHELWPHDIADGELLGSDRRAVVPGQAGGQGWRRIHLYSIAARRPGNHAAQHPDQPDASRDGHRGPALLVPGSAQAGRSHRRLTLWRHH